MNKENNNYTKNINVIELDMADVFWRLLSHWKVILLFSVICAVILMLAGYKADLRRYESTVKETDQKKSEPLNPSDELFLKNNFNNNAVDILAALDKDDRVVVMNMLRQEKKLDDFRSYAGNSLYMNLDSEHVRCLTMSYVVDCNGNNDKYADLLANEYQNLYQDVKLLEEIKKAMGLDVDVSLIKELITTEADSNTVTVLNGDMDSFHINIWIPESITEISNIEQSVKDSVERYHRSLTDHLTPHGIRLVSTKDYYTADTGILMTQADIISRINNLANNIKVAKDGMSGNQSSAYEAIMKQKENPDTSNSETQSMQVENQSIPGFNIKYFIAGIILGIFIFSIYFVIRLIMSGVFYSARTLQTMTHLKLLGRIHLPAVKSDKLHLLTNSSLVEGIRYRSRDNSDIEIDKIDSEIANACHYNGLQELVIFECGKLGENVKNNIELLSQKLISREIKIESMDLNLLMSENNLTVNNLLLVIQREATKLNDIKKIMELADLFNINILGMIYYE